MSLNSAHKLVIRAISFKLMLGSKENKRPGRIFEFRVNGCGMVIVGKLTLVVSEDCFDRILEFRRVVAM